MVANDKVGGDNSPGSRSRTPSRLPLCVLLDPPGGAGRLEGAQEEGGPGRGRGARVRELSGRPRPRAAPPPPTAPPSPPPPLALPVWGGLAGAAAAAAAASSGHFAEERRGGGAAEETHGEERRARGGSGRARAGLSSIAGISRGEGTAGEGDRRAAPAARRAPSRPLHHELGHRALGK